MRVCVCVRAPPARGLDTVCAQRMGYMYRLRIQVVLAVWLVALVAIIIALVVATIVGWHLAAVVSIMAVRS